MDEIDKIMAFLKKYQIHQKGELSSLKITTETNKFGENLFYIRVSNLEKSTGSLNYANNATYYGFNANGDYIGYIHASVSNINPPSQVEIEYWANLQLANQGNITALAHDVINEIFVDHLFDNLKVKEQFPCSNIDTIMVAINPDNYPSLAVARKLGFDSAGYLTKSNYLAHQEIASITTPKV